MGGLFRMRQGGILPCLRRTRPQLVLVAVSTATNQARLAPHSFFFLHAAAGLTTSFGVFCFFFFFSEHCSFLSHPHPLFLLFFLLSPGSSILPFLFRRLSVAHEFRLPCAPPVVHTVNLRII